MPVARYRSVVALTAGVIVAGCGGSAGVTTSDGSIGDGAPGTAGSTTAVQASALAVTFEARTAGIEAEDGSGVFFEVLELPSGTVIATGIDTSAGDTGAALIYRSTDSGATFTSVPRPDPSEFAVVLDLIHHDGITYAFGRGEHDFGLGLLWRSADDGETWAPGFVPGVPTASAVVDAVPMTAAFGADGGVLVPRILRGDLSDATHATTPAAVGAISDFAELPDGRWLAVGERSDTDPAYDSSATPADELRSPADPLDQLVWVSTDDGAAWSDLTPAGRPFAQWATVATRSDDGVVVGAFESTPTGDGYTMTMSSTTDGTTFDTLVSVPVAASTGDRPNLVAIEVAGTTVVALVSVDDEKSLVVYDVATGASAVIPSSTTGLRLVTGLTTLGGAVTAFGATDDVKPGFARLTPQG